MAEALPMLFWSAVGSLPPLPSPVGSQEGSPSRGRGGQVLRQGLSSAGALPGAFVSVLPSPPTATSPSLLALSSLSGGPLAPTLLHTGSGAAFSGSFTGGGSGVGGRVSVSRLGDSAVGPPLSHSALG